MINFVQLESIIVAKNLVRRYIWLIDTIRSCPKGITFEEINQAWERSVLNDDGTPLPKRTFHAHIDAILDEFGIEITCDRSDGYRYRIEDEMSEYGSIRATLIDSLVLLNAIAERPTLKNRIVGGIRYSHPHTSPIIKAMCQSHTIRIDYYNEGNRDYILEHPNSYLDFSFTSIMEPYGVAFYDGWFLVGRAHEDGIIHVIELRNIIKLEELEDTYVFPEDFDLKYYCDHYSVMNVVKSLKGRRYAFSDDGTMLEDGLSHDSFY